jgi:hypothetical protein
MLLAIDNRRITLAPMVVRFRELIEPNSKMRFGTSFQIPALKNQDRAA